MKDIYSSRKGGQTYNYFNNKKSSTKTGFKKRFILIPFFAVVIISVMLFTFFFASDYVNTLSLSSDSCGVSVKYIESAPDGITAAANLTSISEHDLINANNTCVFKGKVIEIKNISIAFKNMKEYRAIVGIEIKKVINGDCTAGDTVKIMLPCAIGDNIWVEDNDVLAQLKVGMTGIFMPYKFDDLSVYKANGATLALKDIADFGFYDGRRYAFLSGEKELIFSRQDYPSISGVTTLEEIENYILINKEKADRNS